MLSKVAYTQTIHEVDRIWEMEEKLCKHHGKNFSQLHKDLVRKEYATITM